MDKSPLAAGIDYSDQLAVFRPQLELAKELNKPVAVHCIDAFDDLLEIMRYMFIQRLKGKPIMFFVPYVASKFLDINICRSVGPFPAGVILHSFNGTAEVVPKLAELGAYFSLSGWFTYIDEKIAKNTLKSVCFIPSITIQQLDKEKKMIYIYIPPVFCRFLPIGSC